MRLYLGLLLAFTLPTIAEDIALYGENPKVKPMVSIEKSPLPSPAISNHYQIYTQSHPVLHTPISASTVYGGSEVPVMPPSNFSRAGGESAVIKKGTFRENMVGLAAKFNFGPIVWDPRTKHCIWVQETQYKIEGKEPKELLAFYAGTQDFKLAFSNVDEHIQAIYTGPEQRLAPCMSEVLAPQSKRPEVLSGYNMPYGAETHIKAK